MNICTHCGASVEPTQLICSSCGCKCAATKKLTLRRKKQYTGCAVAMDVIISGENYKQKIVLSSGQTKDVELTIGNYIFDISCGLLKGKFKVSLAENSSFEMRIKVGAFANRIVIDPIVPQTIL